MIQISIILATFRRVETLRKTLYSFTQLDCSGISYEIILVDNAVEQATKSLAQEFAKKLPITYLAEPQPGKNAALISALSLAQGELIIFTDDDVIAEQTWVKEIYEGALRHPRAQLFGGRILPSYPEHFVKEESTIDFNHWFLPTALVIADWDQSEGVIDAGRIWGPNMAVRREVFISGISFNPNIGPNGKDYVMGSETEFLKRAQAAGYIGVYLPRALVYHQIRLEQLTLTWMQGRAYRAGKGSAAIAANSRGVPWMWGAPRYLWRKYLTCWCKYQLSRLYNKEARFNANVEMFLLRGELEQYRRISRQSQKLIVYE